VPAAAGGCYTVEVLRTPSPFTSIRSGTTFQRQALLDRAWALPVARLYAPLLSQNFTSICGPTSVANVLRSLQVPTGRNPFRRIGLRAMSLDQLTAESRELIPAPWRVQSVRPASVEALREELRRSNDLDRRAVLNFSRAPLFGGGGGHHSPLGGYLEAEDLAFVLDVNASYGPWLVTPERLFEAMDTTADWSTGLKRGLARFERLELPRPG
jgi:hypothetical protein